MRSPRWAIFSWPPWSSGNGRGQSREPETWAARFDFRTVLTVLFVYGLLTTVTTVLTTGMVRLLRENEQGLRAASERLERLADMRRSFLHVVLHDLRSPVGTVVAMLEGLGEGLDGQLGEAQKRAGGAGDGPLA